MVVKILMLYRERFAIYLVFDASTDFIRNVRANIRVISPCMKDNEVYKEMCQPHSGGKLFGSANMILCMSSECTLQL